MNIYTSQIPCESAVQYPLSHKVNSILGNELRAFVGTSELFSSKYGEDWSLVFRMSPKLDLADFEIRGPTVFRKDKDVEYTIFIPFFSDGMFKRSDIQKALHVFVKGVEFVLCSLKFNADGLAVHFAPVIAAISGRDDLMTEPLL